MTNSKHFGLLITPAAVAALLFSASAATAAEPAVPEESEVPLALAAQPDPQPAPEQAAPPVAPPPPLLQHATIVAAPPVDNALRRGLAETSHELRLTRMTEGFLGLTAAGALIGTGFVTQGDDMTWSHVLWVGGGVAAAGSVLAMLIPSDIECLAGHVGEKSDAELRAEWKKMAESYEIGRRAGAVFGGALGTGSIIVGSLVLDDQIGDLSDDSRKILGTALIAGGALTISQAVVDWIVPSSIERGYARLEAAPGPNVAFSAAPTPGGASVALVGTF